MNPKKEGPVTWRDLYETVAKVEGRVNRVEKVVLVLCVVTLSPKLGGPSAPDLVTGLISLL